MIWFTRAKLQRKIRAHNPRSLRSILSIIPSTGNVIAQFGAEWCQPCKALRPFVEGLAPTVQATFVYLDVEKSHELASFHSVRAMPTVLLLKDGVEVARVGGNAPNQVRAAALNVFRA